MSTSRACGPALERVKHVTGRTGRVPLPDDAGEREAAIDALLASGEARLSGGILNRARPMTMDEWLAKFAPERAR